MHELGMCEGVVAAVEQRAQGRPVSAIGVRAGTLLRVVPEAFQASFAMAAAGGSAADATTEVTITPIRARCVDCDATFDTEDPFPACPECDSVRLRREGGDELVLEWIAYRPGYEPASDSPSEHPQPTGS